MKKIILITEQFPYTQTSETFLEAEINFWSKHQNIELTIMPMKTDKVCRKLPKNINIDLSFASYLMKNNKKIYSNIYKILYAIKSFNKDFFINELVSKKVSDIPKLKELLLSMRKYFVYKDFFQNNKYEDALFYTYWHNEVTYALQTLRKTSNIQIVTRTHRFDLYEDTTLAGYMPLRRSFKKNIDELYTITDSAIDYIVSTYEYNRNCIKTSRLGVIDKNINTLPNVDNIFHIASCSGLRPVKQVDKIIDLINQLSQNNEEILFLWTHIGDGPQENEIKKYASSKLDELSNVKYNFQGPLSNSNVFNYYQKHKIDVFINCSESEGVPVSIMEALSCHIPIVAFDVGGISDMVINNFNGKLLSDKPSIEEFVHAFDDLSFFKMTNIRDNAYTIYKNKYSADDNYEKFIQNLILLTHKNNLINNDG